MDNNDVTIIPADPEKVKEEMQRYEQRQQSRGQLLALYQENAVLQGQLEAYDQMIADLTEKKIAAEQKIRENEKWINELEAARRS